MTPLILLIVTIGPFLGRHVAAQHTNALPGQPPIVFNNTVLPDRTFIESTALQAATGAAAKQSYTDFDLYNFLINTECLEAIFDSWAAFGVNLHPDLVAGGPTPIGFNRANISPELLPFAQETARDEAGHVRLIRSALGDLASPCPLVNLTAFATFFGNAVAASTTASPGPPYFNCYMNDVTIFLCIWSLEEIGATGDKEITVLIDNATMRDGACGLAQSAGYQAAAQPYILWERRNETVPPWNLTVAQVMQAMSNYRNSLDGPSVMNILTFGAPDGRGGFFPNGLNGRINLPTLLVATYNSTRPGTVYRAFQNTGYADPRTSDEPLGSIPFLPSPPTISQTPAPVTGIPPAAVTAAGLPISTTVENQP